MGGTVHAFTSGKAVAVDATVVDGPDWDAPHYYVGDSVNVGALIYAGASGKLTNLNSVATGRALISQGVGAAAAWSSSVVLGTQVAAASENGATPNRIYGHLGVGRGFSNSNDSNVVFYIHGYRDGDTTWDYDVSAPAGSTAYGAAIEAVMKATGNNDFHNQLYVKAFSDDDAGSRTVTQQMGVFIDVGVKRVGSTLTIPTAYALKSLAPTAGATNWNIYAVDGANYFGGSIKTPQIDGDGGSLRLNNAAADTDVQISSDATTTHFISDAGLFGGVGAFGFGAAASDSRYINIDNPALTIPGGNSFAKLLMTNNGALTVGTGTSALVATARFIEPNIALNGNTVTLGATVYIDGAPTEGANNSALHVAAGRAFFGGAMAFGTFTSNADAPVTGYITITDAAGNTRKLAVIA